MDKNKTVDEIRVQRIEELYRGLNPNQREFLRARFPGAKNDAAALVMLVKQNKGVNKRTVSWWKVHDNQFKECYQLMLESVQSISDQVQHDNLMEAAKLAGEELVKLLQMPWYTLDGRTGNVLPLNKDLAQGKVRLIEHLTGNRARVPKVSEPVKPTTSMSDFTSLEQIKEPNEDKVHAAGA